MHKRFIPGCILVAYSAFLIKLMVLRNLLFKIGSLRFKVQTDTGRANFVPFKTILPYLLGENGWSAAIINLLGNIVLLVPIGFLIPFIYQKFTWQKCIVLAISAGLAIECMEVVFKTGIFDIDDVLFNALSVVIGYWIFIITFKNEN